MHSNFSTAGKSARELIPVPELPAEFIRSRSFATAARDRVRSFVLGGAICLAAVGAGAGLGGKIYDGVHVWLSGGKAAVTNIRSLTAMHRPKAADVRAAIARATFPVVFPVGLPAGTRVTMMGYAPAEHPNFIMVMYWNRRAHVQGGFSIFDSTAVNTSEALLPPGASRGAVYTWRVGGETVVTGKHSMTVGDVNAVRAAMMETSASDSLAATDKMLTRITMLAPTPVLGDLPEPAKVAERYASPNGRSVLLGRQSIASIARILKEGKPILDTRIVSLGEIPNLHGDPDYTKAKYHWPKVVAVPAGGVRAIGAVLRSIGHADCGCEILFDQPNGTTYWIWTIPMTASGTVSKYAVDAKTLAVTPQAKTR
ncbi:MAG TPA: hypothetical protein VIJ12_05460 [Candidatus Baltobacteraceae bacterium]